MFLDLSGDRSARWPQTMHTGIMFADLSGIHSKPLIESRLPEKCSWAYRGVHLRPRRVESNRKNVHGPISPLLSTLTKLYPTWKMFLDPSGDRSARWPQTMHTGIMFADLSGIHSEPLIESCQPEKYSWSYSELSRTVAGLGHLQRGRLMTLHRPSLPRAHNRI